MSLVIHNTLTRSKEPFEPLTPGKVLMYCCGVTVYDYCHLGHARSYIVWDTIRRYLTWRGYDVRYVQNFTDIDDKILNRAKKEGSSMAAVAEKYTQTYFEDMQRLNILEADAYPRATRTIDGIQTLIQQLQEKGFAYPADGDVYYAVRCNCGYGKLSGRTLDDMKAGASGRVDDGAPKKKDPFDFALWKAARPGEPFWESPWGNGRPGWHIECSAMVREHLGESIDLHVGGSDLVFPHHENEIAQSEVVTGQPLARYWMHNGMVNVGGEKMSKSLGNFTTIRGLLDSPNAPEPMAVRLFVLQAHYRKPIDFTDDAMIAAQNSWNTLKEGLLFGYEYGSQLGWDDRTQAAPQLTSFTEQFQTAMDDDFNTPVALAVLFDLAKQLQREGNLFVHQGKTETEAETLHQQWQTLVSLAQVLGLEAAPAENTSEADGPSDAEIDALVEQRSQAKQAKNFAEADHIRSKLQAQGITLIDQPGGITRWHRS
ncbi:cysteine--tRNA ligase [Leptolyngbya sp. FACHB-36]|uniref:cysteine--tRNA ligase n=1 Tax=Leptolyngbya sp. FACHB-36 TaxID=2692808 RepID=UPI0016802269|nr:cysteine--tRNA ligase [Leptolyngbya sp. FACHB-36]MBD2021091.1 cysteine--tRNA ligase [Leptolyngbya sp. FACHB-36]